MYRTSVPGISAIGDVITVRGVQAHPQLAHVSSAEGIVAAERIAGRETRPSNYIPRWLRPWARPRTPRTAPRYICNWSMHK
jgi:pyruvate/2-oxoglutarate dehydrogenase complex dihydrolipoamide dehydrogenase (E3) component